MKLSAYRISVIYIVISFLWIALSDRLLVMFQPNISSSLFLFINSSKGMLFVCFTGYSLYKLITIQNTKLAESDTQYRIIYENSPLPMWIYDLNTFQIVSVNNAAIKNYGYTKEEFLSKTILDIRPKDEVPGLLSMLNTHGYRPQENKRWVHLKSNGNKIYVNISSRLINFGDDKNKKHVMIIAEDVTEKVNFERKLGELNYNLQQEKRKLHETQQIARLAGWEFYPEIEQLVFSDEMFAITGISRPESGSLFMHFMKHIHPDDKSKITGHLAALIYSGKQLDITYRVLLPDDSIRYIRQFARLDNQSGQPTKIVGSAQNISELKLMEQERNKVWVNLEETLNNINDGFYALDKRLHFTKVNKNFVMEVGRSADEIIGKRVTEIFPGFEDRPAYTHLKRVMHDKVSDKFEAYSRHFKKWLSFNVYPTEEGVAVYFNDVTEQRAKDQQLKEALERYDMVSMATQDIIYDHDVLNDKLVYNGRLIPFLNLENSDQIIDNLSWWRSLIHPDDIGHVSATQQQILDGKQTNWECEYRVYCGQEGYKYVFDQGYFIYNNAGEPTRLIGAIKDINDLMVADEENRRLAQIITNVDNLIVVVDTENRIVWVNKAFEQNTGYMLSEVAGLNPRDFLIGEDTSRETLAYVVESRRRQQSFSAEFVQYTKNKGKQWISSAYTPLYNDVGKHTGYIAVQNVITARKEREDYINSQNKILQEVAWLSSHEIRRPVASILGLTYLYKNADSLTEKEEILNLIDQCANDLDSIVHNITARVNNELSAIYIPADNSFEPDKVLSQARFKN